MNINSVDYSPNLMSLDIYISGCASPHCDECHNPMLWDFEKGQHWTEWKIQILDYMTNYDSLIKNVMLFGGDPLD